MHVLEKMWAPDSFGCCVCGQPVTGGPAPLVFAASIVFCAAGIKVSVNDFVMPAAARW